VVWDSVKERPKVVSRMLFAGLVLSESQRAPNEADALAARRLLAKMAKAKGVHAVVKDERFGRLLERVQYAAQAVGISKDQVAEWVDKVLFEGTEYCASMEDMRGGHLYGLFANAVPPEFRLAGVPDTLMLPSGREVRIDFGAEEPFVESYLQDFFGWKQIPTVASKPLVVHLLAPNRRPVQITRDLPSFWKTHYPSIRKELMRKYPRHDWPEDPSVALPMRHKPRKPG
jgi:ATP-dependent helicase HrpB